MLMLMMPVTMLMLMPVKFEKAGKPTLSARKQELPSRVQVACPHTRGIGPGNLNYKMAVMIMMMMMMMMIAIMDEEETGSEKVMVEKADLAEGLLLELEEERSRSYNRYFCLFF